MTDAPQGLTVARKEQLLLFSAVTTFASLIPTAYAAWISNSVILRADFLRCLVDFSAIFVSWLIVRQVLKGDRSQFNYGFGKFEHLSGMLVGCAMFVTAAVLVFSSIRRFEFPEPVENGVPGFILSVLSVCCNAGVWIFNHRVSINRVSPLIDAQRRLFKAKTFASMVVFASLLCSIIGSGVPLTVYADPVGSLMLSGFICFSAFQLISTSMSGLVDASLEEALQFSILGMLVEHDAAYTGLGEIRSRRAGAEVMIEIFLEFDPVLQLAEVHRRVLLMKEALKLKIPFAIVSIIPLPQRDSGAPL